MNYLDGEPGGVSLAKESSAPASGGHGPVVDEASGAGACPSCGAGHREEQEWCLSCGARLYSGAVRGPGLRSAAAVVGLTVLLAGGASAASYAALQDDASRDAGSPAPPAATPLVQAQAPVTPTTTPPATTAAPSVVPPDSGAAAPDVSTPESIPSTPSDIDAPSTSVPTPVPAAPSSSPAPVAPSGGSSGGGGSSSGGSSSGGSSSNGSSSESSSSGGSGAAPAAGEPYASTELQPDLYDPAGNITNAEAARDGLRKALDGSTATSAQLVGAADGFGYLVELGANRPLSSLRITGGGSSTFGIQVYGTRASKLPGDILNIGSTGWEPLAGSPTSVTVGKSTKTVPLKAADGKTSYRKVVVWVPQDRRANIAELELIR